MQVDEITVSINGTNYAGWTAADVTRSMDAVCGEFNVELFDRWGELEMPREIRPGDECQVFAGGEPVITGYVDSVRPSIGPNHHKVAISGRDKICDLVDCSAELESFELLGVTLDALAQKLCAPFGTLALFGYRDYGSFVLGSNGANDIFVRDEIDPGGVDDFLITDSETGNVLLRNNIEPGAENMFLWSNDEGDIVVNDEWEDEI